MLLLQHGAGAQALVSKGKPEEIARALQTAQSRTSNFEYEGIPFETPANAFLRLSRYKASGLDALSNRENEIIDLCRHGKTSKDIADYLGVTTSTVETHLRRASENVGAHNRMELVAIWLEHRIKR